MSKFICDYCGGGCNGKPCILDAGDDVISPHYCIYGGEANWKPYKKKSKLKKLVEEVFAQSCEPTWYKVGNLVWSEQHGYGKIERIDDDKISKVIFSKLQGDNCRTMSMTELAKVRIRPWTFEEAPETIKVRVKKDNRFDLLKLVVLSDGSLVYTSTYDIHSSAQATLGEKYERIDGLPFGIIEHRNKAGEWVK